MSVWIEIKGQPLGAGVHVLVAIGSAALMTVTLNFSLNGIAEDDAIQSDPTRLVQSIVGGLGFLKEVSFIPALIFLILNEFYWPHIRSKK